MDWDLRAEGRLYRFQARTDDYGQGGASVTRLSDGVVIATLSGRQCRTIRKEALGFPQDPDERTHDVTPGGTYTRYLTIRKRDAMHAIFERLMPVVIADLPPSLLGQVQALDRVEAVPD
jgi:hypothetical protein